MNLKEHPTWSYYDSSKISCFIMCARKYFYQYILGWEKDEANIHLEFGKAWHLVQEALLLYGYGIETQYAAYEMFEEYYRKHFSEPESDKAYEPKTPENVKRAISQYCQRYMDDKFDILHTEIGGSVPISDKRKLYFRLDSVIRNELGEIFCLEHKTAKALSRYWSDQWPQSIQVGTYSHVLFCLYPKDKIFGIVMNGYSPHNAPRMKKDGTPYIGEKDNEFMRFPIKKTLLMMEDWLWQVNHWYSEIEREHNRLYDCSVDDPTMQAFPKNPNSCTSYSGCPYGDFCRAWPNPLRRYENVQPGYTIKWWNPKGHSQESREVVDLT